MQTIIKPTIFSERIKISPAGISLFEWNFIILGGLPFLLPAVMQLGENALSSTSPIEWYFWMGATLSAPHVYSSYLRLNRKIQEGRLDSFWGLPLYALCVVALIFCVTTNSYLQIMTAINVWQSYHYARQVYGVSRLYSGKSAEPPFAKQLSYMSYHLALPLFVLGRWSMLFDAWSGKPSDAIIPFHVPAMWMMIFAFLAVIGASLGLAAEYLKLKDGSRSYNPVGLVILLVYYFIHSFGFLSIAYYQRGFFAVTMFHAIQYMALIWWFERAGLQSAALADGGTGSLLENPFAGTSSLAARHQNWICRAQHSMRQLAFSQSPVCFLSFFILLFGATWLISYVLVPALNVFWLSCATVLLGAQSAHHYATDTVLWRAKAGK